MSETKDVRALIEQIDALLAINTSGNAVPRIPGLAVELLTRSRTALAARPAPEAGSVGGSKLGTWRDLIDLIQAQAAQIASLSAKVAEVERERDAYENSALIRKAALDQVQSVASELQREVERLRKAIDDALGRHQVTHIHAGLRAALKQEGE